MCGTPGKHWFWDFVFFPLGISDRCMGGSLLHGAYILVVGESGENRSSAGKPKKNKKWWFPMVIFYQGSRPGSYDWEWGRWGEVGIPGIGNRKCENTVADGVASILSPSASKGFWELWQRFWHHQGVMFAVSIWNTTGVSNQGKSKIWNPGFEIEDLLSQFETQLVFQI